MAKIIVELSNSDFYFLKNTFAWTPFAECSVAKAHSELEQFSLKPGRTIDEKCSVSDLVFLGKFPEKRLRGGRSTGDRGSNVKVPSGFRIDGTVEPEPFAVDLDSRFLERDLLRITTFTRFKICFLHPVVDRRSRAYGSNPLKYRYCIGKRETLQLSSATPWITGWGPGANGHLIPP